ncbi:MAG TPA: glycosyltransferase family 4 protein [archaeon]|nr:glycosyltransferase family 4 protein [archaeon]
MSTKVVFLSTYPPRECGIATFTKDLSESIQKKFGNVLSANIVALNESESRLYKYPKKVLDSITEQEIPSYELAAQKLNSMKNVGVVNIQHEFGIFGGECGEHLLKFMSELKKSKVTTLHTVLDDPSEKMKSVVQQICSMSNKVVVMTKTAKQLLSDRYGISNRKIEVIAHGVPTIKFGHSEKLKKKYGITNSNILLTFGMLSRGKGIENVINSLPQVLARYPDTTYLIVGETHPRVREHEGESYRTELIELAKKLKVGGNVKFLDKFLTLKEIIECLRLASVYVSPSLDPRQICSGTISYAMGAGKAIIASNNKYNSEVLSQGRGIVLTQNSPEEFSSNILEVLSNKKMRETFEKNAFEYSRSMTWPNVSTQYFDIFCNLSDFDSTAFSNLPRINFSHFSELTDDFGIIQFCRYSTPDKESGYTLDDNSRALAVALKAYEKSPTKKMLKFTKTYMDFIEKCQTNDGKFHNVLDGNREFADEIGSEDSFGRTIWALSLALNSTVPDQYRLQAKKMLERTMTNETEITSPRAQAETLIGMINSHSYLGNNTSAISSGKLLDSLISHYENSKDGKWNWFENYLTYGNSRIPEALFEAKQHDKSGIAERIARESMDFLTKTLFIGGKLVPIGQENWYVKGKVRSIYDQQPIEAAGMTTAYLKAFEKTGEEQYLKKARASFDWFLGKNSGNQVLYDESTGGCFDGLTRKGVNANQGAESTISYLFARLLISNNSN